MCMVDDGAVRVTFGFITLAILVRSSPRKRGPSKQAWIPAYAGMSGRHRTCPSPRAQRLYLQLRGQFDELGEQRRRNRNTVAGPLIAAGGAALARQADRIE